MAIKRVAVMMTIDTGEHEQASGIVRSDRLEGDLHVAFPGADETYMMYVNDDNNVDGPGKPNKARMLDSAAHELGHLLTSVFKVKGGMHEDPRQRGEFRGMFSPEQQSTVNQCERLWGNELLAWKIAEKIRPQLDTKFAAQSLDSYHFALDKVEGK